MSKSRQKQSPGRQAPGPQAAAAISPWSPRARWVASVLLAVHLLAVFVAPWSYPPPSSLLAQTIAGWFAPYLQAAYLDHGYRFFAPNPGPSHLVVYELEMPDRAVRRGRFPDLNQHWPRLLYHRHFMISEATFDMTEPFLGPPPAELVDARQRQAYQAAKRRAELLLRSLASELLRRHDARSVKLWLHTHLIPDPWEVQNGMRLDDPSLFEERMLGEFDGEQP